jgi:putative transposase
MYLPGIPCHIVQRGNNREATFFSEQDYCFYLNCLLDATQRYKLDVHAYVLMTNHVHILATPDYKESISLTMQSVGRRYVQYVNKTYFRTGTLWESRHKTSLVDAERYLFAVGRYIEMNPGAANMVRHPAEYRWSSYRFNALGQSDPLIVPHQIYQLLGTTDALRWQAYAALFNEDIDPNDVKLIRNAVLCSMPTGDNHFTEQIEKALNRKVGYAHRGRPRKRDDAWCK